MLTPAGTLMVTVAGSVIEVPPPAFPSMPATTKSVSAVVRLVRTSVGGRIGLPSGEPPRNVQPTNVGGLRVSLYVQPTPYQTSSVGYNCPVPEGSRTKSVTAPK